MKHILRTSEPQNFNVWMAIPDNAVQSAHSQQQLRHFSKIIQIFRGQQKINNILLHVAGLNTVEEKHEHNLSHYFAFTLKRSLLLIVRLGRREREKKANEGARRRREEIGW